MKILDIIIYICPVLELQAKVKKETIKTYIFRLVQKSMTFISFQCILQLKLTALKAKAFLTLNIYLIYTIDIIYCQTYKMDMIKNYQKINFIYFFARVKKKIDYFSSKLDILFRSLKLHIVK